MTKYFLLVFFLIYGPVFNSISSWIDFIFISSCIIFGYGAYKEGVISNKFISIFYVLFLVSCYVTLVGFINGNVLEWSEYMRIFFKPVRIIITLYGCYYLAFFIYSKYGNRAPQIVLDAVYFSIFLHAVIIIIQLLNSDFRDFIYSYTTNQEFRSDYFFEFRMGGLSGDSGGAVLSVTQSLGILFLPFLKKKKLWKKLLMFLSSIVILLSVLITGRSGLYAILIFYPLSLVLAYNFQLKALGKSFIKYIFLISLLILLILNFEKFADISEGKITDSIYRSLDSFIVLMESGDFEVGSVDELKDHVLFPSSVNTLLFGEIEHIVRSSFYRKLDSDIGYVRDLWSYGLFGLFFYALPILYILISISRKLHMKDSINKLLFLLLLIILFFHSKESFLYTRMLLSIMGVFLFTAIFQEESKIDTRPKPQLS